MKRLVSVVVLVTLAVASGCNASPSAAIVNGTAIPQSELNAQLTLAAQPNKDQAAPTPANQAVQCALSLQGNGTLPSVTGAGGNTVTTQFASSTLESLVLLTLEKNALARRHLTVTAADIAQAKQDYEAQLEESESEGSSPCGLQGSQLTDKLPKAFLDQEAVALAYQEKLEEAVGHVSVGPAALMAYYNSHTANLTQVCLNVIVADTAAAGQAILSQVQSGTDFATASQGTGVDSGTPPGGEVPCSYPSEVAAQFGDTLAGTIDALTDGQLAPSALAWQSQTQSGSTSTFYLVVQMRKHQLVPFASVSSAIRQVLLAADTSVVGTTLNAMVAKAQISVDPQYGTWSAQGGVTVPVSPLPAFVLNRTADQPPAAAAATSPLSGLSAPG